MPKNLVIVESPTKAKTLARYLGKDYEIKSSFGHIRDLPKKDIGVDIAKNFEPTYQVAPDKKKIVRELKSSAKGSTVWLASDPDREGEAIAWHICNILGLDPKQTKRIVFHEFTEPALRKAIAKPQVIDMKLVDAQQARRILDRLVGYELSPVLWKKIRTGLSAGRVQSVAVRLIVEREREIKDFKPEISFKITANFKTGAELLPAELDKKLPDIEAARRFMEAATRADFTVGEVEQKPGSRSPAPPFTTSTLQQEASRRLGFSVRQTMTLAQRLYENGHITYMRTDSTNLSLLAIEAAKTYITKSLGAKYSQTRQYKTKSQSAQEAHEAIRPTNLNRTTAGADQAQKKLYELIWRRMLASQMTPAKIQRTVVTIDIADRPEKFIGRGEVLVFDGFLKIYGGGKEDLILPSLKSGQKINLSEMNGLETYSRPPSRYAEASLVKKLEELGIGRPSTYAPTISTIQDRGYVEKADLEGEDRSLHELVFKNGQLAEAHQTMRVGADKAKLVPTPLANVVTDFLSKYFAEIVDYDFTAKAEAQLDDIAEGKLAWQKMLDNFYQKFHPLVKKSESANRAEASQARTLGIDPKTKQPVIARFGRYGPMLQRGEAAKDKDAPKPTFAPLPEGATLETITLDQALPMFELPKIIGQTVDGQEISVGIGRFGPYLKVGSQFISIKGQNPHNVTLAQALELIKQQHQAAQRKVIADYGTIKILRGPYGPYITNGQKNLRIPKGQKPEEIDVNQAEELLKKPARSRFRAKK